ncbi:MAG TPA: hypothetical protein VG935_03925, partial [Patescibacteria group bacterium]|nr:hypothetical protein [Patescibacteria group bacterium]
DLAYQGYQGEEKISLAGQNKDVAITMNVQLTASPIAMLSWWLVGALGVVVVALSIFIFFLLRKRRRHQGFKENMI